MAGTRFPLPLDSRAPSRHVALGPGRRVDNAKVPTGQPRICPPEPALRAPAEGEEMWMEWAQMLPAENAAPCARGPLPAGPGPGRALGPGTAGFGRAILPR